MRQDTLALVQSYYAAFNRGDWDGMLALLTDDVAHDLNQGGRQVGRAAFARWHLNWEPGTAYQYHALSGHWVLAEIIERRTGKDFRAFIRERILDPMGLAPELDSAAHSFELSPGCACYPAGDGPQFILATLRAWIASQRAADEGAFGGKEAPAKSAPLGPAPTVSGFKILQVR